ncbi:winged helix-turn-helix domain-containing protein [Streptomyces sp. NPDC002994]|uniref:ArsR/SmtB family transcription factor n=1 Tax=Streptomyces sp. NPDC002994 TaxID=3154441 RepID=UPI0033AB9BBA
MVGGDELLAVLAAVGHPQRLRVIAELAHGRMYVSELARRLEISRPLLYLHLERLEKVGLVAGSLDLSDGGKALKYFELRPFELNVDVKMILAAVQADEYRGGIGTASAEDWTSADGHEPVDAREPDDPS